MTNENLTDNSVERLKISLIERSLDNIIYKINPQNANFYDLTFDGDDRLIARQWLYSVNNDILFMLINGSSVYV